MPLSIKVLLDQGNFKQIQQLYARYLPLINTYRDKPVLNGIIEEIEEAVKEAQKIQLKCILKNIRREKVDIFVGLHASKE